VEVDDPRQHRMHSEWYSVPPAAAETINAARAGGGAVWAVGTTSVRTLETVADEAGVVHCGSGWTDIFIRESYRFRAVDHLITNFHLPRSTLLMLVAAMVGRETILHAYAEAIKARYRFYSYGDAMAIV
jgi:S-adenosylmethionine:tRNA ribosyltransferase-isomerase